MARLRQTDRDAVVLRYFENKSLREVGGALGLQERAAQKADCPRAGKSCGHVFC